MYVFRRYNEKPSCGGRAPSPRLRFMNEATPWSFLGGTHAGNGVISSANTGSISEMKGRNTRTADHEPFHSTGLPTNQTNQEPSGREKATKASPLGVPLFPPPHVITTKGRPPTE